MTLDYNKMRCNRCGKIGLVSSTIRNTETQKKIAAAECLVCDNLQWPANNAQFLDGKSKG